MVSTRRRLRAAVGEEEIAWLKRVVDEEPRLYHDEISRWQPLRQDHGIRISTWNCIRYMHLLTAKGGLRGSVTLLSRR